MLKCTTLHTFEIDNPGLAVDNILEQLSKKITLLQHSVGIIMCHPEFIATGALKQIYEALPFDLAGITTSSQSVNDEIGETILTIFVMTSDDARFLVGVTGDLSEGIDAPLEAAYKSVTEGVAEQPKLAIIFPPLGNHSSDAYVRAMEKCTPNTPVFGSSAIDDTVSFEESETIYNGMNSAVAMPFVLCYGNIQPRFLLATLPANSVVSSKSKITEAKGNVIYEINNMNALEYFKESEYSANINYMIPFLIDLVNREDFDGIPVMRGFTSFTDDGAAVFGGDVDEGSTFTLLNCDPDDIISTTCKAIRDLNKLQGVNGAILFSCVVRRAVLLSTNKPLAELLCAKDMINPDIPFMMGYSGGEMCPTSIRDGVPTNRFHNYTVVVLAV